MTKPTMELVEEYGRELNAAGYYEGNSEDGGGLACRNAAHSLLSEIRQRLEAMERREAELESDLAEAAKCAFQYAAKVGVLERDAARYRWLRDEKAAYGIAIVQGLGATMDAGALRAVCTYAHDLTGEDADAAIDAAMAEGK